MLIVTEPAGSYDLINLNTALAVTGSTDHSKVRRCLTQASDVISRWCNRIFPIETLQETFQARDRPSHLVLARYPVVEIVSIIECDATLAPSDYHVDRETGVLLRLNSGRFWAWPAGNVVVTYRAGYATIPGAVQRAAELLVARFHWFDGADMLVRSVDVPDVSSRSYLDHPAGHLPAEVEALLSDYRRPAGA